jgi:hypothetical protein
MKTSSLKLGLVALAAFAAAGTAHADHPRGKGWFANVVRLEQNGRGNGAAQAQNGAANTSAISQNGVANTGTTSQTGVNNTAVINQKGNNNDAGIVQTGSNNQGCLLQVGNNLDAQLIQDGGQSANVLQTKKGVAMVSEQVCVQGGLPKGRMSRLVKIATN